LALSCLQTANKKKKIKKQKKMGKNCGILISKLGKEGGDGQVALNTVLLIFILNSNLFLSIC